MEVGEVSSGAHRRLVDGGHVGHRQVEQQVDFATFFDQAPAFNPIASLIKGVVCGVRVEDVDDPLMQKIRYLDKLIDELAKGKAIEKILRQRGA